MWEYEISAQYAPIGYKALVDLFGIKTISHFRWSFTSPKWEKRELYFEEEKLKVFIYPPQYALGKDSFEHIEFALKHEGTNLFILKKALENISRQEIEKYIQSRPTGKYARIIWFLYESFFQKELSFPNLKVGSYIPLLNPDEYYCAKPIHSARHKVSNNLLGSLSFSPMIRKGKLLSQFEAKELDKKAIELTQEYDRSTIERAMRYLSTKETLSSWEIEREKPDTTRLAKCVDMLLKVGSIDPLNEAALVQLQKEIVDPRFALEGYRTFQNYIGEEPTLDQLIVHYISPKPEDVPEMMKGLLHCYTRMAQAGICPVITATVLSFGFVFIHPFWDGNGRLHRFLLHHALTQSGFAPKGFIFPIASALLRDLKDYDAALEEFSRPLVQLITDYSLSEKGEMTVNQDTREFYQYIDYTRLAEFIFTCVEKTLTTDLKQELQFLTGYDKAKQRLKEIVDMPDQSIDLFIRCIRQNGGKLSSRKRETYFSMLRNDEITRMEEV